MESADLHHLQYHHQHQLKEQLIGSSSSTLATSTTPSSAFTNNINAWNPNLILISAGNLNSNINGLLSSNSSSSTNPSMMQELGFHDQWASNGGNINNFSSDHSAHELHLSRIKEFPKFSTQTTMNGAPSNHLDQEFHFPSTSSYIKHEHSQADLNNLSHEKLLLKTFSSACQLNGVLHHQVVSAGDDHDDHQFYSNSQNCPSFASNRENFSQIFPRNNLDSPCSAFSSSLGMNLQTLDLWNPTKFGASSSTQPPHNNNNLGLFKQAADPSFVLDHLQESSHSTTPSYITNKKSAFMMMNGSSSASTVTDHQTKRSSSSSSSSDHHRHHHHHVASKKPRTESRSSFPPFKVRKEKLGDRIAALQQLVAPFGKTDTASVLMEAIGYIKFLQDQVETLSVPYMKSSRSITRCSAQRGSYEMEGSNEMKRDLRSRGLCLVPLSCTSYVTNDDGGGVWSVPNFGG